jgi:ABC-type glycerol-3-phosphate transport system substrate-binding protein
MRVIVWLVISLVLLGIIYSFSTCRAEQSDGRVVLTLFSETYPTLVKLNRDRIALFEKENPDIKVRLVIGDANKYLTTPNVAPLWRWINTLPKTRTSTSTSISP